MFQKITTWMVIVILGLVPLFGMADPTLAQANSGFPGEIGVDELASGEVPASATTPAVLTLERIRMPSKSGLPVRPVSVVEILYVEQGTLTVADGLGLSSPLEAEKTVSLRAGSSYTAINDGTSDVSFLRLSLTASSPDATPAVAVDAANPPSPSDKVEVVSLANFDLSTIPTSPTILFLDRATWKAGADSGSYTQTGPIGMYTESGVLTISSPSGIDGQLDEGKAVLLPADQVLRTRNDGTNDAVALLFGIIPADGPLVTAEGATTGTESATTSDSNGENTAPAPAGTVLYQDDATTGFEGWSSAGGWITAGGMLVNDGSNDSANFNAAPYEAPGPDYAVEVEMQWVREGDTYGIVVRGGGDDAGYWIGPASPSGCSDFWLALWAGPASRGSCIGSSYSFLETSDITIDSEWHTYRIEVRGNAIRVLLDGATVIETTDNRFLTSGQVGVWSEGAQVNIRRFTVIALGDS